jgi:hypothetical protein
MGKNHPDLLAGHIDLHIHTYYSDGTYSPTEAIENAARLGLAAISITDHDCVAGIDEGITAGSAHGVELIPGVELSADGTGSEIHVLGYFIDWQDTHFRERLAIMANARRERAQTMVTRLNALGVCIDFADILKISGGGTIGRLHVAKALRDKGYVADTQEAFNRYIGRGCPAFAEKYKISPENCIALIHRAGGIAVLAHPGLTQNDGIIPRLKEAGLDGIEVYHIEHTDRTAKRYIDLADRYALLHSGGSDCHGLGKTSVLMGKVLVPYRILTEMKAYIQQTRMHRG